MFFLRKAALAWRNERIGKRRHHRPRRQELFLPSAHGHREAQSAIQPDPARNPDHAGDAAQRLNIPSNKVSFHLRVLAEAGLIEEAPELARDRRDRVWRAVDTPFDLGQAGQTEENIALSNALMEVFADEHRELLHKVMVFADQNMRASEDLGSHAIFTSATLYLTDEQFKRAVQQFMENIRESAHSNETIVEEGRAVDEGLHQWHIDLLAADETI